MLCGRQKVSRTIDVIANLGGLGRLFTAEPWSVSLATPTRRIGFCGALLVETQMQASKNSAVKQAYAPTLANGALVTSIPNTKRGSLLHAYRGSLLDAD
jgi:hypothetical protein